MLILDTIDRQILSSLRKNKAHPSLIAKELRIPRTSVAYRLQRLKKFNRVESKIEGRKTVWKLTKKRAHNKELIHEFSGPEYYECYKILYTLPKLSALYILQGVEAGKAEFKTIPHYLIEDIHTMYRRRKIIMRAIVNKKILSVFDRISDQLKKSHLDRTQGIQLTDSLFTSSGELFVAKDFVLLVNPEKKRAVTIKDADIVMLMNDFMQLFYTLSDELEHLDLNKYIRDDKKFV